LEEEEEIGPLAYSYIFFLARIAVYTCRVIMVGSDFTACPICFLEPDTANDNWKCPQMVVTPCGHSQCMDCYNQGMRAQRTTCPVCLHPISLTRNPARNFALEAALENMYETRRVVQKLCDANQHREVVDKNGSVHNMEFYSDTDAMLSDDEEDYEIFFKDSTGPQHEDKHKEPSSRSSFVPRVLSTLDTLTTWKSVLAAGYTAAGRKRRRESKGVALMRPATL